MKFKEYGKKGSPVIVMIHGENASAWNYEEQAILLSEHFFVILPEWEKDQNFKTIEESAKEIEDYITEHKYGRIAMLTGTGVGGMIVIQIISENPFLCSDCILESVPLSFMSKSKLISDIQYFLLKLPFAIRFKAYAQRIPYEKYEAYYQDQKLRTYATHRNIEYAKQTFQLPKLYRVQAKTLILVGENENKKAKKAAQILYRSLIDSELETTKTRVSGEFSRNHPQYYVVRLMKLYKSIL